MFVESQQNFNADILQSWRTNGLLFVYYKKKTGGKIETQKRISNERKEDLNENIMAERVQWVGVIAYFQTCTNSTRLDTHDAHPRRLKGCGAAEGDEDVGNRFARTKWKGVKLLMISEWAIQDGVPADICIYRPKPSLAQQFK